MGSQTGKKNNRAGTHAADMRNGMDGPDCSTRRRRRAALKRAIAQLASIRDAEQKSLDNVPDSLQCTESYEEGELAVDALDEALDLLAQIY